MASAEHKQFFKYLGDLYTKCDEKLFFKMPIMVAVAWHFAISVKEAKEFWTPILTDIGGFEDMSPGVDPRKLLKKALKEATTSQHASSTRRTYSEPVIFNTCNKYWNYWRSAKVDAKHARVATSPVRPK
jgi:hypothetical protein